MNPTTLELIAASCFFGALLHAFSTQKISTAASRAKHPILRALLHFTGEIEIVFGLWAGLYIACLIFMNGFHATLDTLQQKSFIEPIFVFAIMIIASSRPILETAKILILKLSRSLTTTYALTLILTPLFGSFITEPAAMTVAALLLKSFVFDHIDTSQAEEKKLLYSTVATLFVNISIGGLLTDFAAPPVLMVARNWDWNTSFMMSNFGWKAAIAVIVNSIICLTLNKKALSQISTPTNNANKPIPLWIRGVHLLFLAMVILSAHYPVFTVAALLFFLGFAEATVSSQSPLKIREALLVSFFLGGLVVLTGEQGWWLKPILNSLSDFALYLSAAGLTAITDNAAITSLAAQVPDLALSSKLAVMGGAVVGGGLTLIANAPNPAGYAVLRDRFGDGGLEPWTLFLYAITPTLIAGACLWIP